VGEHAYILSEPNQAQCFELKTGKEVWNQKRLSDGSNWSSLVVIGDRLYVVDMTGRCFILKASPKFELLGSNSIGELVRASIAVADGELFIRSYEHLWCIGK
jgi:hypothetical protein